MIGAVSNHIAWLFFPSRFFDGRYKRSGLRIPGWETVHFIDSQDELQQVNRATGDVFLGGAGNAFLEALLGPQSVFLLDDERHRFTRRLMGSALTNRICQQNTPKIDAIIAERIATLKPGRTLGFSVFARQTTMQILCKVVLDVDDAAQVNRIYRRFEATTGFLANIVSYYKPFWKRRRFLSVGTYVEHLVGLIDKEIYAVIATARAQKRSEPMTALDVLLAGQDEHGYDDAYIRDNLVALLAAGYDTTGSALSWCIYWMGREQGVFARAAQSAYSGDMRPISAFRAEVLRYCPPIEILPRRIRPGEFERAKDLAPSLAGSAGSESGDGPMVCPCVHRVHHDPSVHKSPDRFDPDRFAETEAQPPNSYMPFGAGVRMCLGINYGKLIADRFLLAFALQNLRVDLNSDRFAPVRRNVSLWPGFTLKGRLAVRKI